MSYSSYADHYRDQEEYEKLKKRQAEIERGKKAYEESRKAQDSDTGTQLEIKASTDPT